jgi:hypothetical protein
LDVLDAVAPLFGVAKKEESIRQLPAPKKPKQIEHRKPPAEPSKGRDMDDDIPF